jgi:hypothetical protein
VGPSAKEKAAARAQLEAEARMVFESVDGDGNGLLDAEELQTLRMPPRQDAARLRLYCYYP